MKERLNHAHVIMQGCSNSLMERDTHENSCRKMNNNVVGYTNCFGASMYGGRGVCRDDLSEIKPAQIMENIIHKKAANRQDSSVLHYICLADWGKQKNESTNQVHTNSDAQIETSRGQTIIALQKNSLETPHVRTRQGLEAYSVVQLPQCQTSSIKTVPNDFFCYENETCSGILATHESSSPYTTSPHSIKPWQIASTSVSTERLCEDNMCGNAKNNSSHKLSFGVNWDHKQQTRKYVQVDSPDGAYSLENNVNAEYKSLETSATRKIKGLTEKDYVKASGLSSDRRLEALVYGMFAVMVILSVAVVRLQMKVHDLETDRCNCQEQSTLVKNELPIGIETLNPSTEDKDTSAKLHNHFLKEDIFTDINVTPDKMDDILFNENNRMLTAIDVPESISRRTERPKTIWNSKELLSEGNSLKIKMWKGKAGHISASADSAMFENVDEEVEAVHKVKSRHIRSSGKEKTRTLPQITKQILQKLIRGCKQQVSSFVGDFYKHFNFSTDFIDQESVTHRKWRGDIVAYRDSAVKFDKKNTTLPFYKETHDTKNRKLVHINDNELGVFRIQKSGNYLVNVNMTIINTSGTPYLALYLNGIAVLACADGGFRSPETNEEHSGKYRICNIGGLLELAKNDTLDIRTMQDNMTLRIEKQRKSIFKIVLIR